MWRPTDAPPPAALRTDQAVGRLRAGLGLQTDHRSQVRHDEMNKMSMHNETNIFNNLDAYNCRNNDTIKMFTASVQQNSNTSNTPHLSYNGQR